MVIRIAAILGVVILVGGCATRARKTTLPDRTRALLHTRATYCNPPRLPTGRVDVDRLVTELVDLGANTYSFCIHRAGTDWEDLQLLLPKARAKGIRVWASIVPPSESPPRTKLYAEPFRLDYERWAIEFAKLSQRETNLVAWSIDDFTHNLKFFTPEKLKGILDGARSVNPNLAFVPCCYFRSITTNFAKSYAPLLDGVLFPYRDESSGSNLKNPDHVLTELTKLRETLGLGGKKELPVILDVYATAHSRLGATTPQYVEQVMITAKKSADGVMVYCHQDPKIHKEKYQIIQRVFAR
jgi:hypothetical protein